MANACGGSGVAQRVELVCAFAHFRPEVRHLGVAARVVGNGAVGVGGEGYAEGGEHSHGGYAYAVKAHGHVAEVEARGEEVGEYYSRTYRQHRNGGGEHSQAYARYYNRCRAGFSAFAQLARGTVALRGEVFGGASDDYAHDKSHNDRTAYHVPVLKSECP